LFAPLGCAAGRADSHCGCCGLRLGGRVEGFWGSGSGSWTDQALDVCCWFCGCSRPNIPGSVSNLGTSAALQGHLNRATIPNRFDVTVYVHAVRPFFGVPVHNENRRSRGWIHPHRSAFSGGKIANLVRHTVNKRGDHLEGFGAGVDHADPGSRKKAVVGGRRQQYYGYPDPPPHPPSSEHGRALPGKVPIILPTAPR
jgi:hypothetical protein